MEVKPSISFVLPMFNERDNIKNTIHLLKSIAAEMTDDYEIVIVDDASTDGSADSVREVAQDDKSVKLFCLEKNTKFGGAFAQGFKKAEKDVIMYMDSDLPVGEEDIKGSLPFISDYDIVTGYSKVKKGETLKRKFISGVYNFLVQSLFGLNVKDINSGYKIVKKDMIKEMEFISHSPFVDVELFLHAKRTNRTVYQYGLVFNPRPGGKSYIASLPIMLATFSDMLKVKFSKAGERA